MSETEDKARELTEQRKTILDDPANTLFVRERLDPDNEHSDIAKEQGRWQVAIYDFLCRQSEYPEAIDGGGCDSGDPLDFTLAEINQLIVQLKNDRNDAVARLTGERDAQAEKRLDILLNDDCIRTIKKLTPEGGEEISFGGIMGGVRLKWSGPTVELPNLPSCRVSTGHCWIANEGNYKSKCINCNLLATWKLPTAESIDTETALSQTQQALRRRAERACSYWVRDGEDGYGHMTFREEDVQRCIEKWLAEAASDTPQIIKAHSKSEYKRLVVQAEGKNVVVEPPSDTPQGAQAQEGQ
jgi:hypothetical protein